MNHEHDSTESTPNRYQTDIEKEDNTSQRRQAPGVYKAKTIRPIRRVESTFDRYGNSGSDVPRNYEKALYPTGGSTQAIKRTRGGLPI